MFRLFELLVVLIALVGVGFALPPSTGAQGQDDRRGKPAWPNVFVGLGLMYDVTYEKPIVGKGEKPETYQQKAIYSWTGGRFEVLHVTLARDPAFKEKYSAEVLKKEKNAPKELEINKRKAWQWKFPREELKFNELSNRLVVLLDLDKAIIIEQFGSGLRLEEAA